MAGRASQKGIAMNKAELQARCQGAGDEKHINRLLGIIKDQYEDLEASTERTPTHIYCENCDSIQPMLQELMCNPAANGQPLVGGDLVCGTCKLVIATVWRSVE